MTYNILWASVFKNNYYVTAKEKFWLQYFYVGYSYLDINITALIVINSIFQ